MQRYILFLLLAAFVTGCQISDGEGTADTPRRVHAPKRAMYHWKNTFDASSDLELIEPYRVGRLYIRFFDVTLESNRMDNGYQAIPTATVRFINTYRFRRAENIPEIVPTVFITPEAMAHISRQKAVAATAQKMLQRIDNMCSYYQIPKEKVTEIQLDCDWTLSTEQAFFELCSELRRLMPDQSLLSSTIRLHQLRKVAPPVDYGVLMLYNTNNLRNPSVKNSILSADDVSPYLRDVHYSLPLDFAYPTFSWDLWFHDGEFRGIVRSKTQTDSLRRAGEMVRHEEADFDEIVKVKRLVSRRLCKPDYHSSTVLYHLDKNNLNRYTDDEKETLFGPLPDSSEGFSLLGCPL